MKHRIGVLLRRSLPPAWYSRCCRTFDRARSVAQFVGYQGWRLKCPLCGMRFRRFVADAGEPSPLFTQERIVGGGPFENASCPFCYSFERERHVYLFLRELTDVFARGIRLLHVAPEKRLQRVLRRQRNIDYVTADLASPLVDVHVDLTRLPFPDDSFDVVLCNHVLEHIPADRQAMAEILRVLKPRGWALLQVPIAATAPGTREETSASDADERLRRFGQRDHVRLYGLDYRQRLADAGFGVRTTGVGERFGPEYLRRFALIPDEQLYIATKPGGEAVELSRM